MEKASYGTLWTIKPHLRETKGGKISPVKGFQQKRLRFKPGYRVIRHDAKAGIHRFTQQGFPVMGTVLSVKELTAKVKWDAGRTVEEPYNNLKLAKSQTPNAPEMGMKERGYRRKLGIHRPPTSKVQGQKLRRPPTPLGAPVAEGATKSIVLEELSAMKKSDREKNKLYIISKAERKQHPVQKSDEFYVILQKSQQVRVKPHMRAGRAVAGYVAPRNKARQQFGQASKGELEIEWKPMLKKYGAKSVYDNGLIHQLSKEAGLESRSTFTEEQYDKILEVAGKHGITLVTVESPGHVNVGSVKEAQSPYDMGRAAFKAGKNAVPAQDKAFVDAHIAGSGKPGKAIKVLDEWIRGWHEANVAAPLDFTEKDEEDYYREMASISGSVGEPQTSYTDMKAYPPQFIREMSDKQLMELRKKTGNFNVLAYAESELVNRGKLKRMTAGLGKVGESQEPYSRKLTFESGQKLRSSAKVASQIEDNKTKPQKFLKPETKKSVNNQLHALGTYHDAIPWKQIDQILSDHGLVALQEDNTEWGGFFLGNNQQVSFPVATVGSKVQPHSDPDPIYEPAKNTVLNLSWYKMGSGRYEIIAYLA